MLKRYILATLMSCFMFLQFGYGQKFNVSDGTVIHDKKVYSAVTVTLDPSPKEVKDAWKDFIKDQYDVKLKGIGFLSNKDLMSAEAVMLSGISDKEMDFYTKVVQKGTGSEMMVFGTFGYHMYISQEKYPAEYAKMHEIVDDFLQLYLPDHYNELLVTARKNLEDLEKDHRKLLKDITDNEEKIRELQQEIREDKIEAERLEVKIAETRVQVEKREMKLNTVKKKLIKG